MIPAIPAAQDAALARRAIEHIHPGFDRYADSASVGARFDALEARCRADVSEAEFFALLSEALAAIRCSHTKAEPSPGWSEWRTSSPSTLPFRFIVDEGRMVVTRSAAPGVTPGDEVVSIDGVSAGAVLAGVFAMTPADGWTDDSRWLAVSSASDLDECELDHFLPALLPLRDRAALEIRAPGAHAARTVGAALLRRGERPAALGEAESPRNLDEAVSLDVRDRVAVLRVRTFVAYRKPIKPEDIYRPYFERIAAASVSTLILDLRDNGGGSDSAAIDLTRYLTDSPLERTGAIHVRTYRFGDLADRLETWDRSVLSMPDDAFRDLGNGYYEVRREPAPPAPPLEPGFRGRLIVLCGPANTSGATLFLAGLKARREVTLVGEPTGGSVEGPTAGVILFLPLPNTGIRVRIPARRSVTGLAGAGPHGGLSPDVLVRPTVDDVLAGRDPVLERALGMAGGR